MHPPGSSDSEPPPPSSWQAAEAWHALPVADVTSRLEVTPDQGLAAPEAERRLEIHGPNRLPEEPGEGWLSRFLGQFRNVLIYILLAAAMFTAFLGEWIDTGVILLVVVVNAVVGFVQEGKAEEALEGIRKLLSLEATVIRDGHRETLSADRLVPGDIVRMESGDRVPADVRILTAHNVRIEEALLTGESQPVAKGSDPVREEALVADRTNMAFSGTLLASGRITGVVVATGSATEIGRIGELVSSVEGVTTPLLRQIERFGKQLSAAIVGGSAGIFLFAWLVRGFPPEEAFLAVVALSVAAIPEGLPAILTITLALGVQRMARRNAIVRRLPAVETLGSVTVICTDKTGTLTRNEMSVERVLLADGDWEVSGSGYLPEGGFRGPDGSEDPLGEPVLKEVVRVGLLCNESDFVPDPDRPGERKLQGDPTEGALIVLAEKAGLDPDETAKRHPRLDLIPFESERRWMGTLHRDPDGAERLLLKGAPERILGMCDAVRTARGRDPIDRSSWEARMEEIAGQGYRLLALAIVDDPPPMEQLTSTDLGASGTLLGVVALMDPPRPEAAAAVAACRDAGIRVVMITGDHAATGRSIGARMGIGDGTKALTGQEIERATDEELREGLKQHDVVARASPEHKLRIVRLLQEAGAVAAMTGDGVNDAPALKQADIGVAMGIKGSEAARSASEMVLADDNFASIANAVEEGRTVYDNLRKTILFILPTNGAEALVVLAAVAFAFPDFPITPAQILWVNMITAVTLALALAFEPAEPGLMERPPRDPGAPILSVFLLRRILYVSLLVASGCLLLFHLELSRGAAPEYARTVVVNALVAAQLWYLFTCRFAWHHSVGWSALVGNRAVLLAAGVLVVFQLGFTYLPPFQLLFRTSGLEAWSWLLVLSVGLVLYLVVELEKAWGRRWRRKDPGRGKDRLGGGKPQPVGPRG